MALILRGKTICPLCGNLIGEGDDVFATPAFLKSTHPLSSFSDAAFHAKCFAESEERERVESLLQRCRTIASTAPTTLEEYEVWVKDAFREFD
jgi:hypothetical protein